MLHPLTVSQMLNPCPPVFARLVLVSASLCIVAGTCFSSVATGQDNELPHVSSWGMPGGFPTESNNQGPDSLPVPITQYTPGTPMTKAQLTWLFENFDFYIRVCMNGVHLAPGCQEGGGFSTAGAGKPPTSSVPANVSISGGPSSYQGQISTRNGASGTCCDSGCGQSSPMSSNFTRIGAASSVSQSVDYAPASCVSGGGSNGCSSGGCGSSSSGGGYTLPATELVISSSPGGGYTLPVPELVIGRQFRPRNFSQVTSFGPGAALGYDIRIDMGSDETGALILTDPSDSTPKEFNTRHDDDDYYGLRNQTKTPYMLATFTFQQGNDTLADGATDATGALKSLRILKADGALANSRADASLVEVENRNGTVFQFEVIRMTPEVTEGEGSSGDPGPEPDYYDYDDSDDYYDAWNEWYILFYDWATENGLDPYDYGGGSSSSLDTNDYSARLVSMTSHEGRSLNITYKTWTNEQVNESPERQWQIDSITDSKGQTATFEYAEQQVSGGWVVSQINLPNGGSTQYEYTEGKLSRVIHADGSESTFSTTMNQDTQQVEWASDDPRSTGGGLNRRKTLWLTSNFVDGTHGGILKSEYFNQASMLTVATLNGEQEVTSLSTYTQRTPINAGWGFIVYEGGGVVKAASAGLTVGYMTDWGVKASGDGTLNLEGTPESQVMDGYSNRGSQWTFGRPESIVDETGIRRDFEYDDRGNIARINYGDGTYETAEYNEFQQLLRQRDRSRYVTKYSYDAKGHLLTKEVGLLETSVITELGAEDASSGNPYQDGYIAGYRGGYDDAFYALPYNGSSNTGDDFYDEGFEAGYSDGESDGFGDSYSGSNEYPGIWWYSSYGYSYYDPSGGDDPYGDGLPLQESTLEDVPQPEYAMYRWEYYPEGSAAAGRVKTAFDPLWDGGSADTHRVDFEYDTNGNVTKKLESASITGQDRPEYNYEYNAQNQLVRFVDPSGHEMTYKYNLQNQLIRTSYDDGSTEETLYGLAGSGNERLVVATKDRRNVVTAFDYDNAGRQTEVIVAVAWDANILDGNPHDTPITDRNEQSITNYEYLDGTAKTKTVIRDGSRTDFLYDYRGRVVETRVYPSAGKVLISKTGYLNNRKIWEEDPYGRRTYYGYRESDGALVRVVKGAYPASVGVRINDTTDFSNAGADSGLGAYNAGYTEGYLAGYDDGFYLQLYGETEPSGHNDYYYHGYGDAYYSGFNDGEWAAGVEDYYYGYYDDYGEGTDAPVARYGDFWGKSYGEYYSFYDEEEDLSVQFEGNNNLNQSVLSMSRDEELNPQYVIKDMVQNLHGDTVQVIDERGIQHDTEVNTLGQVIREIEAVGTPVEAITESIYDAAGNVVETRSPRYFDPNDTNGYEKCRTTMTYDGANRVLTRTEAPGTPEEGMESYAYDLSGRQISRTDA